VMVVHSALIISSRALLASALQAVAAWRRSR
jgi:hypothetical protein